MKQESVSISCHGLLYLSDLNVLQTLAAYIYQMQIQDKLYYDTVRYEFLFYLQMQI